MLNRAGATAEWLIRNDAADRSARFDLASVKLRIGLLTLRDLGQPARAMGVLEEGQAIISSLEKQDPDNRLYRYNFLVFDYGLGQAFAELGRDREAAHHLERARQVAAFLSDGSYAAAAQAASTQATLVLAKLKARSGDSEAPALADRVAADITGSARMFAVRWNEASASADLGRVYLLLGRRDAAALWLTRSAQIWSDLKIPAAMEARRNKALAIVRSEINAASHTPKS